MFGFNNKLERMVDFPVLTGDTNNNNDPLLISGKLGCISLLALFSSVIGLTGKTVKSLSIYTTFLFLI